MERRDSIMLELNKIWSWPTWLYTVFLRFFTSVSQIFQAFSTSPRTSFFFATFQFPTVSVSQKVAVQHMQKCSGPYKSIQYYTVISPSTLPRSWFARKFSLRSKGDRIRLCYSVGVCVLWRGKTQIVLAAVEIEIPKRREKISQWKSHSSFIVIQVTRWSSTDIYIWNW